MKKKYVVRPYSHGLFQNVMSWGIWNTETGTWTIFQAVQNKRDALEVAKSLNNPW